MTQEQRLAFVIANLKALGWGKPLTASRLDAVATAALDANVDATLAEYPRG